jgi:predicted dehydrogenase
MAAARPDERGAGGVLRGSFERRSPIVKVAIIGCGLVADQHLSAIARTQDAEVVAVCDREILMARQLADRFGVAGVYSDVAGMLDREKPDVVHITTPAQTHFELGRLCLDRGAHVYLEKPFTLTFQEAEDILELARKKGLLMTVGHNLQFEPSAIRMRELVRTGFLGGPPIHMECLQCFSHHDPTYGPALLGDRTHWVRSLPGSLLHNLISHGIAKIAEYLPGDDPTVIAHSHSSPFLHRIGQTDIVDELRAVIHDSQGVTANFTFSTQFAASSQICLYGAQGSLTADSTNRTLIRNRNRGYKSYLRYFVAPLNMSGEYCRNSLANIRQFLSNDFHVGYGTNELIRQFYQATSGNGPLPIPYRQILLTARIMDAIFAQMPHRRASSRLDRAPEHVVAIH